MLGLNPSIKRVVKKEIGQQRANNTPLRSTARSRHQLSGLPLQRTLQAAFNVESRPWLLNVLFYRPNQELVVDCVKEGFQVNIDDPISYCQQFFLACATA